LSEVILTFEQYKQCFSSKLFEESIGEELKQKGLTISVAESCTGGLVSSMLTDVAGSSEYIKLNFVTYSNEAKTEILGVDEKVLAQYGAVSEQTAVQMAQGARKMAKSDMGLAITGIAGPSGGTAEKPVGLVYIAVCDNNNNKVVALRLDSSYSRKDIKLLSSLNALKYLLEFICSQDKR
jgi:nicotinamide-nucleotide amidase